MCHVITSVENVQLQSIKKKKNPAKLQVLINFSHLRPKILIYGVIIIHMCDKCRLGNFNS